MIIGNETVFVRSEVQQKVPIMTHGTVIDLTEKKIDDDRRNSRTQNVRQSVRPMSVFLRCSNRTNGHCPAKWYHLVKRFKHRHTQLCACRRAHIPLDTKQCYLDHRHLTCPSTSWDRELGRLLFQSIECNSATSHTLRNTTRTIIARRKKYDLINQPIKSSRVRLHF